MAEHHLHGPQVSTACQQVGGKGMAQHMRAYLLAEACTLGNGVYYLPEPYPGHGCTPVAQEQVGGGLFFHQWWSPLIKIIRDSLTRNLAKRDYSFFAALAHDAHMKAGQVTAIHRELNKL